MVKRAREVGPQTVTVHGRRAAVVLSAEEFDKLKQPKKPLKEYLLDGPAWPDEVIEAINDRSRDPGRDVQL